MPELSTPRRLGLRALLGMVACCAFWGGNAVAVKAAVPAIPAFGCAGLRFLISLPILAVACRRLGQPMLVPRAHWWLVGLHALFSVAQIGTFNLGTSMGLAGRSSVFINLHPLIVTPLAWALLGEHLGTRGLLGLGSAALGVGVLLSSSWKAGGPMTGDLIVIGSAVVFGIQTVFQKWTFARIPPVTLFLLQTMLATPIFLAYSATFEGFGSYHFTGESIAGMVYQGVVVSGFCFTTWMVLLRLYPAGQLATIAFLTPLFGISLGNILRGEQLTWPLSIGGGLVGLGIYLAASGGLGRKKIQGLPRLSAIPLGEKVR